MGLEVLVKTGRSFLTRRDVSLAQSQAFSVVWIGNPGAFVHHPQPETFFGWVGLPHRDWSHSFIRSFVQGSLSQLKSQQKKNQLHTVSVDHQSLLPVVSLSHCNSRYDCHKVSFFPNFFEASCKADSDSCE